MALIVLNRTSVDLVSTTVHRLLLRKPNMQIRTEIEIYLCIIAFVVWSLDSSWFNLFVNKLGNVTSEQGIEINRKSFSREIFKWFFSHGIQIFLRELIVNISRQLILALLALILLPLCVFLRVLYTRDRPDGCKLSSLQETLTRITLLATLLEKGGYLIRMDECSIANN